MWWHILKNPTTKGFHRVTSLGKGNPKSRVSTPGGLGYSFTAFRSPEPTCLALKAKLDFSSLVQKHKKINPSFPRGRFSADEKFWRRERRGSL
jgi:hypothetical protein